MFSFFPTFYYKKFQTQKNIEVYNEYPYIYHMAYMINFTMLSFSHNYLFLIVYPQIHLSFWCILK